MQEDILDFLTYSENKEYVLVGGQAILLYMYGRTTKDIDLLVRPGTFELSDLVSDNNFGRGYYGQLTVDLLYTTNSFFEFIYTQETNTFEIFDFKVKVATIQNLILLKCYALPALYRQGQFRKADIYESDLKGLFRLRPDSFESLHLLKPFMGLTDYSNVVEISEEILLKI